MGYSIEGVEFVVKIHNLSLTRKRGVLSEELPDIEAINEGVVNIYNKSSQYYQENPHCNASGFFRINQQYFMGIYINTQDCKRNPYIFIYDRIEQRTLTSIDYDLIMELKDKVPYFVNKVYKALQNNYSMVNKEAMSEIKALALQFDEEMER